jgi:DNA-binding PadR family transcriptional regulator
MPPRGRASDLNATAAALLALLHTGPMTGGQLVSAAAERFGAFFSLTRSQVYRELPALTTAGLLKLGDQGPRASQQYVLTAAGKRAFRGWLTSGGGSDALRSPLVLRLLHAGSLTGRQRAELVSAGREAFSTRLASARAAARGEADPFRRAVADFAVAHNRAMVKLLDAIPLD